MDSRWPYPFWIAHRGAGRHAPENTLAALRHGAERGYRAFEVDAKLSADGVPFLLHDTTLDRTTTEHGRASDRPWAELQGLDAGAWHHSEHAFEPIPSLEQAWTWCAQQGLALNIEIKPTPGDEAATGRRVAEVALAVWQRHPTAPAPLLSSFQSSSLEQAREAAPQLPRALLINRLRPHWLDEARQLGCVACVVQHELVEAPLVEAVHAAGFNLWVYTVNQADEAQRLADWGVDGLITDAVALFNPAQHPRLHPSGARAGF